MEVEGALSCRNWVDLRPAEGDAIGRPLQQHSPLEEQAAGPAGSNDVDMSAPETDSPEQLVMEHRPTSSQLIRAPNRLDLLVKLCLLLFLYEECLGLFGSGC